MNLPVAFTERMKQLLGPEYPAFEASYQETRKYALRVNTLKITPEEFERIAPFHLTPVPWIRGAYYYQEEDAVTRHPYYYAGLYYIQEPSAMTPASVLEVLPGDRVLDLCAAPGGKATALGAKLAGEGLLVANDISASRCRALLRNIELFGIRNAVVTNAAPAKLVERFPQYFDKVLVDAPCSGEGMFRKDEDTIRAWYPQKPADCAKIQRELVLCAADMLKDGGQMLYSTCTFSTEENEETVRFLLEQRKEMRLLSVPRREGFGEGLLGMTDCVRLWPHRTGGEGHFLALLQKGDRPHRTGDAAALFIPDPETVSSACDFPAKEEEKQRKLPETEAGENRWQDLDENPRSGRKQKRQQGRVQGKAGGKKAAGSSQREGAFAPDRAQMRILGEFFSDISLPADPEHTEIRQGFVYYVKTRVPELSGVVYLRYGLYLGEMKKDRFEPSQSLAMALRREDCRESMLVRLDMDTGEIPAFLRGEEIELAERAEGIPNGWKLVLAGDYPLGWGKLAGSRLKNKYPSGWRIS